mmetsp:Transcript_13429/g.56382  ORF Transcript_13429/g.56382 Transcript_13429/m.56382 type:complete len:253 (-) Transcript_13429:324-1082(-)
MDADNVVLNCPEYLFKSQAYVNHGMLLWKDFWISSMAPDMLLLGIDFPNENVTHETGQVLVNKQVVWKTLLLACYMNSFPNLFYPLTVNYMGLGEKELLPVASIYFGLKYGLIRHGPDHVGVWTDRAVVFGNTMMQHDEQGRPIFLHANVGKWTRHIPADFNAYVRRWQSSMLHGNDIRRVIAEITGIDFERWIYDTVLQHRHEFNLFEPVWYETLDIGPLLDGMFVSDHIFQLNPRLELAQDLLIKGLLSY